MKERWWVVCGWMTTKGVYLPMKTRLFKPREDDYDWFVSGPFSKGEAIIEADRLNRITERVEAHHDA